MVVGEHVSPLRVVKFATRHACCTPHAAFAIRAVPGTARQHTLTVSRKPRRKTKHMKIKTLNAPCGIISALLLFAAGTTTTSAAVVYSDSFSRSGILNGSAPDVTNSPGQTWIAANDATAATVGYQVALQAERLAFLPVNITANNVYTLQADLNDTGSANWMALGFSLNAPTTVAWHGGGHLAVAWALDEADDGFQDAVFGGVGSANGQTVGVSGTGFHTYKIVLDTMAPQWTVTWFRDSVQTGSTFTYASNPTTISHVGFGTYADTTGTVDNFSFSEAVPEPTSSALLLGSGAMLLRRRRRAATPAS